MKNLFSLVAGRRYKRLPLGRMTNSNLIAVKLGVPFGFLILILLSLGWLGLSRMGSINSDLEQINKRWNTVQLTRQALNYSSLNNRITMEIFFLQDSTDIELLLLLRAENEEKISAVLKELRESTVDRNELELLNEVEARRARYDDSALRVLTGQNDPASARKEIVRVTLPLLSVYDDALNDFREFQGQRINEAVSRSKTNYEQSRRLVLLWMFLVTAMGVGTGHMVTRGMIREVDQREQTRNKLAQLNSGLEQRVSERTADLAAANLEDIKQKDRLIVSEARFLAAVRATDDIIWEWEVGSNQVFWASAPEGNPFGIKSQQSDPFDWFVALLHPDDQERVVSGIQSAIASDRSIWLDEYRASGPGGSYVFVLDRGVIERDTQGKAVRMIGAMSDISQSKLLEQQLRAATETAESANLAKSEFLANMSHEIRTPLNGVIGMTDLALETELTGEQREYLDTVKMSADSLLIVINDILDCAKIEAGKLDLEAVDFDVRECMEGTLKTLAVRADEKGVELLCDVAPDVSEIVKGDCNRLRQVLINLVGNAIKFTHKGEVALRVEPGDQIGQASMLHFTVSDTGIGIPLEKQKSIFDPFTQADTSTTRKYGGTGLGLTISARIVELMNGKIWVESEVGQGTRFHFTVQLEASDAKAVQTRSIAPPELLRKVKVLVVDDNRTNRRILEGLLNRWEMKSACVEGGDEALAQLSAASKSGEPFGLILTDMHMPEMDGFTLIERIRQQGLSTATIMMLTSAGHRGDAARCEELGVSAYLLKPIRQSDLREGIAKALGAAVTNDAIPLITRFSLHEGRQSTGFLNILLAEDNVVNQRLAMRLLEKRGHRVVLAANGHEALEAMEKNRFDLILMDVQMPEMDGIEATRAIREIEKSTLTHTTIIALTAHAMAGDRESCLAAGMDGYLSKPIRPLELDDILRRHVDLKMDSLAITAPLTEDYESAASV